MVYKKHKTTVDIAKYYFIRKELYLYVNKFIN